VVVCPECRDRVVLALGKKIRHHARHRKGVECLATQPETALHLNTKYYLADVLHRAVGTGATLRIRRQCVVGNRPYSSGSDVTWIESTSDACQESSDSVLVARWDEVRVESRISDQASHRIPDIVLLENGRSVGAIEVFVSHEVDPDKSDMFRRLEVPWVEVQATDAICDRSTGWTVDQSFEPRACSIPLAWRCALHDVVEPAERRRPAAVAERPPERSTLKSGRIVDVYLASGTWRRVIYRVRGAHAAGALARLALDRDGQLIARYSTIAGETESDFLSRVRRTIDRDCDADIARVSRRGAIVDAGKWLKGDALHLLDEPSRPRRHYRFNSVDRQWEPDPADLKQRALDRIESAIRGRRSGVQRSLEGPEE
jgi:hypothetical protein